MKAYYSIPLTAFLCMMLMFSALSPASHHTAQVIETVQDHLEMVVDHGHSHGFLEDLVSALHGHTHEVGDHDHAQVFLMFGAKSAAPTVMRESWRLSASEFQGASLFQLDRPPRV